MRALEAAADWGGVALSSVTTDGYRAWAETYDERNQLIDLERRSSATSSRACRSVSRWTWRAAPDGTAGTRRARPGDRRRQRRRCSTARPATCPPPASRADLHRLLIPTTGGRRRVPWRSHVPDLAAAQRARPRPATRWTPGHLRLPWPVRLRRHAGPVRTRRGTGVLPEPPHQRLPGGCALGAPRSAAASSRRPPRWSTRRPPRDVPAPSEHRHLGLPTFLPRSDERRLPG